LLDDLSTQIEDFSTPLATTGRAPTAGDSTASASRTSTTPSSPSPSSSSPHRPLSFESLETLLDDFKLKYVVGPRRGWTREKVDVGELLRRVQAKLEGYGLRGYEPGRGVRGEDVEAKWDELERVEKGYVRAIRIEMERIQAESRNKTVDLSTRIADEVRAIERDLHAIRGDLQSQLVQTREVSSALDRLEPWLDALRLAEGESRACRVEVPVLASGRPGLAPAGEAVQGAVAVATREDLEWEVEVVRDAVKRKVAFIENQNVVRARPTLAPEQIEEFESAFRAFDRDGKNALDRDELAGALRSLGVGEISLHEFETDENDEINFKEFIRFLTVRSEDRLTGEKVRQCFRSVAAEKGYVTELDLTRLSLPSSALSFLKDHMPQSTVVVPVSDDERSATNGTGSGRESKEEVVLDYEEFLDAFLE
ncbi:hypothetical protein JCM10212_002840, partial [Sporobolomyces blumeae]